LTGSLLEIERGAKHRAKSPSVTVKPIVVVWGAVQHRIPDGAEIDGIEFVAGHRLRKWLKRQPGDHPMSKEIANDLLRRLRGFRADNWQRLTDDRSKASPKRTANHLPRT
jgi:hypothetical protein